MDIDIILEPDLTPTEIKELGVVAEDYGIRALWTSNYFSHWDGFLSLVPLSEATSKLKFGPLAVSPLEMHPLKIDIDDKGAQQIASRARGTPRIANRLLRRARDFAEVKAGGNIDEQVATDAMELMKVDENGFDLLDRKFLLVIIERFGGGPVGIDAIAAAIGEERGTLEDVIEPFLIQRGFLLRTPRGRTASFQAYEHFGMEAPAGVKETLSLFEKSE